MSLCTSVYYKNSFDEIASITVSTDSFARLVSFGFVNIVAITFSSCPNAWFRLQSVGPNIPKIGIFAAARICIGPESLVTANLALLPSSANSNISKAIEAFTPVTSLNARLRLSSSMAPTHTVVIFFDWKYRASAEK